MRQVCGYHGIDKCRRMAVWLVISPAQYVNGITVVADDSERHSCHGHIAAVLLIAYGSSEAGADLTVRRLKW